MVELLSAMMLELWSPPYRRFEGVFPDHLLLQNRNAPHGTTGIENVDYCLSSKLFERGRESAEDYTEELLQFESAGCWQERRQTTRPANRADFGLPSSGSLYFCPQRMAKFHPDFDSFLQEILDRDPTGHICVLSGRCRQTNERLESRFQRTVGRQFARRIMFLPAQDTDNYLRLMSLMDVVLDTPSYSAALTGYDALSFGVPLVTLPGRYMVQRYGLGLYLRMGFTELIASSREEYITLAVRLALDRQFHRYAKEEIQTRSNVLFQDALSVREYERFFSEVARRGSGHPVVLSDHDHQS